MMLARRHHGVREVLALAEAEPLLLPVAPGAAGLGVVFGGALLQLLRDEDAADGGADAADCAEDGRPGGHALD